MGGVTCTMCEKIRCLSYNIKALKCKSQVNDRLKHLSIQNIYKSTLHLPPIVPILTLDHALILYILRVTRKKIGFRERSFNISKLDTKLLFSFDLICWILSLLYILAVVKVTPVGVILFHQIIECF